ncbi:hypothetical protein [uncultured Ruminococcus sp.]|uniref:hypothetical protein n=1 Tax=uncultured Ruminococcus sp. TaxID=165186 RepID=UPI0025ED5DBF|nr:hypothetical protein [uncultured Ruminococcus sp.]
MKETLPVKAAVSIISSANKKRGIVSEQKLEKALQEARITVGDYENYKLEDFKQKIDALEKILPEISAIREQCFQLFNETIAYSNKVIIDNYDKTIAFLIENPDMKPSKKIKHIIRLQKDARKNISSTGKTIALIIIAIAFAIALIRKPNIARKIIVLIENTIKTVCKSIVKIVELIVDGLK